MQLIFRRKANRFFHFLNGFGFAPFAYCLLSWKMNEIALRVDLNFNALSYK